MTMKNRKNIEGLNKWSQDTSLDFFAAGSLCFLSGFLLISFFFFSGLSSPSESSLSEELAAESNLQSTVKLLNTFINKNWYFYFFYLLTVQNIFNHFTNN